MAETLPPVSRRSASGCSRSSERYSAGQSSVSSRSGSSRTSSIDSSHHSSATGSKRECITSLSALYRSAYKPYQFTYMYGTHYNQDFKGRYVPPPLPERQLTARYAPINYASTKTTYRQEFQDREPLGKPLMMPVSRHRKHRPHPNLRNTWQFPNSSRWIWSVNNSEGQNKQRTTKSAGFFRENPEEVIRTHRWYSR